MGRLHVAIIELLSMFLDSVMNMNLGKTETLISTPLTDCIIIIVMPLMNSFRVNSKIFIIR